LIDFKRVRHAARPSKDLRTRASSEAQPVRPQTATIGPRNDLTGILVCRRSAGFTDTFGCHRHSQRPSPPGLTRSANCAWRTPVLQTVQGYRHRASSEAHPSVSRTLTECLRALTGTSGFHRTPPGVHRTPPGVHRRSIPHGRDFRDPPHDPQQHGQLRLSTGRLRSPTRCVVFATSVLGCSPEPPGSTRVPSETRSQFVQTRRLTAIASFRYNGPLVRRPLAEQCNVSGATVVTFESTPGFRLSYRR